jgi:hypothetical protein
MATRRQRSNGQRQGERLKAAARRQWRLNLLAKREPLIPADVLKKLAEMHLPANKKLYTAHLKALLDGDMP